MVRVKRLALPVLAIILVVLGLVVGFDPVYTDWPAGGTTACGSAFLPNDSCGTAPTHLRPYAVALLVGSALCGFGYVLTRHRGGPTAGRQGV